MEGGREEGRLKPLSNSHKVPFVVISIASISADPGKPGLSSPEALPSSPTFPEDEEEASAVAAA